MTAFLFQQNNSKFDCSQNLLNEKIFTATFSNTFFIRLRAK
jgi:hypothetical protein